MRSKLQNSREKAAGTLAGTAEAFLAEAENRLRTGTEGPRDLALIGIGNALCSLACTADRIADALKPAVWVEPVSEAAADSGPAENSVGAPTSGMCPECGTENEFDFPLDDDGLVQCWNCRTKFRPLGAIESKPPAVLLPGLHAAIDAGYEAAIHELANAADDGLDPRTPEHGVGVLPESGDGGET